MGLFDFLKRNRKIETPSTDQYNLPKRIIDINLQSYIDAEIEEYQILGTLDSRTCEICGEQDGKIYKVKDAIPRITYPPFHEGCRCTTVAVVDRKYIKGMTRSARDSSGRAIKVPASMNYKHWRKKYYE